MSKEAKLPKQKVPKPDKLKQALNEAKVRLAKKRGVYKPIKDDLSLKP